MQTKLALIATLLAALFTAPHQARAQDASPATPPATPAPQFAAATIKPPDPQASSRAMGFSGSPGGSIHFGGRVNTLVMYAFGLQQYQVTGGPDWARSEWFDIDAVPPDNSPSRAIALRIANPTAEQRQMLQSLLRDRFGLKSHMETKEGDIYLLTRSGKELQFKPPADPAADPRAIVVVRSTGIEGEAIGINTTTDYLAQMLGRYLRMPVLNQTGITGAYDFHLEPDDPENQDMPTAVNRVVDRLGLKITRSRGPIQTLVIDHVDHPNAN